MELEGSGTKCDSVSTNLQLLVPIYADECSDGNSSVVRMVETRIPEADM